MLAQVEGVGQAGRGALGFERPGKKKPRRSGASFRRSSPWVGALEHYQLWRGLRSWQRKAPPKRG